MFLDVFVDVGPDVWPDICPDICPDKPDVDVDLWGVSPDFGPDVCPGVFEVLLLVDVMLTGRTVKDVGKGGGFENALAVGGGSLLEVAANGLLAMWGRRGDGKVNPGG